MPQDRLPAPEHWSVDAGSADVATLDIPADAQRDRRFEISCRFVVRPRAGADAAWQELRVVVDGAHEWSRRIDAHPGGDSLDYRFRRDVPSGRPLRVAATTAVHDAQRVQLLIEAEES